MITFSIINVLQSCLLANTIMDLVKNKDGYFAVFIFGLILQIVASIFLWVTAAKDPATIPSRVSINFINLSLHFYPTHIGGPGLD